MIFGILNSFGVLLVDIIAMYEKQGMVHVTFKSSQYACEIFTFGFSGNDGAWWIPHPSPQALQTTPQALYMV